MSDSFNFFLNPPWENAIITHLNNNLGGGKLNLFRYSQLRGTENVNAQLYRRRDKHQRDSHSQLIILPICCIILNTRDSHSQLIILPICCIILNTRDSHSQLIIFPICCINFPFHFFYSLLSLRFLAKIDLKFWTKQNVIFYFFTF